MKRAFWLWFFTLSAFGQTVVNPGGTQVIGSGVTGGGTTVPLTNDVSAPAGGGPATVNSVAGQSAAAVAAAAAKVSAATAAMTSNTLITRDANAPGSFDGNGISTADHAATGGGGNGFANLGAGICAAGSGVSATVCDLFASSLYVSSEYSHVFTPAKDANADLYANVPVTGGIERPRFAEDHRLANRYYQSTNALPLLNNYINDRTPFVFEARFTNSSTFADNHGVGLFRLRSFEGTQNFNVPGTQGMKANFQGMALDGQVRAPAQGGGQSSNTLVHTAPGDDIANVVQHDTNGCSENEDECQALFRAFLESTTQRWGGTLNATPTADVAGFGNYTLHVTVGGGYSAMQSGAGVFTVNLSNAYTAGNVTGMLASPYPGTAMFTGDATANWSTQFGNSVITQLTSAIDAQQYNGACPSTVVSAGPIQPNPFNSNEAGVGGIANFCATVASTTGLSAYVGKPVALFGQQSNLEMAILASVVDGTHVRLNSTNPHASGEYLSAGGAQGYGISMVADDIGSIFNYPTQPNVTLHKFFPIVGSNGGNLYVWTNEAKASEVSTLAYASTTPIRNATIGSISTSGTAVTAVNLSDGGVYRSTGSIYNYGGYGYQGNLAAPTLTWTGCTTPPTTTNTVDPQGKFLSIAVTNGGNCSSPSPTLSTTWANSYRIVPLVMAKKVVDPATGSANSGYLMTEALDPTKWSSGSTVEQPGWIHDQVATKVTYGKYFTGSSRSYGIEDATYFAGDHAAPDILRGFVNNTDGHRYYADATHPVGPGVAMEDPPDGYAFGGDFGNTLRFYTPPKYALFDIGCGGPQLQSMSYHPCTDNIARAYKLFAMHSTSGENASLGYDPTSYGGGVLAWSGPLQASAFRSGNTNNTDWTGELTFSGATTQTFTWGTTTYAVHPEVVLTCQFDCHANTPWVTYTGTTSFTINFASSVTGTVGYLTGVRR